MLINISGRTDIVNYYSDWMFKRFEEGYALSRNSLFPNSVRRYELTPEKVDCIIFGSKNFSPVLGRIHEITEKFPTYLPSPPMERMSSRGCRTLTPAWKPSAPWPAS